MKLDRYLKDKLFSIILYFSMIFIITLLLLAFKVPNSLIYSILFLLVLFLIITICFDFFRRKKFYDTIISNIELLDKSYLVLETINDPNFYDGKLFTQILYDINKSMNENVRAYENQMKDFREYIEMWIHEVKIPLSSSMLIAHNHRKEIDFRLLEQLRKIDSYLEQVLYYTRSENAEKDYLIKNNSLDKIVSAVALKNKDDLLEQKIDFIVEDLNCEVLTDAKWLEFILNQIVNNSIKYKKGKDSYIKIYTEDDSNQTILNIEDNGIGISKEDIKQVFNKSFTGENGRSHAKATGMGLFIVKSLCDKLGHNISIESKKDEYTRVSISFSKNKYYDVLK